MQQGSLRVYKYAHAQTDSPYWGLGTWELSQVRSRLCRTDCFAVGVQLGGIGAIIETTGQGSPAQGKEEQNR